MENAGTFRERLERVEQRLDDLDRLLQQLVDLGVPKKPPANSVQEPRPR